MNFGGLAVFQFQRSDWEIHDFASPPRSGFAFSIDNYYSESAGKGFFAVTFSHV